MNLKTNYNYLYIALFITYFFLWSLNFDSFLMGLGYTETEIRKIENFVLFSPKYFKFISFKYIIVFLTLPIFYKFIKEKKISIYKLFNNQKYIIFLVAFIVMHFFLVNILYNEVISKYEIFNLAFLVLLTLIYSHYRNFLADNIEKIIFLYLIFFVLYSFFENSVAPFTGECNSKFFLTDFIQNSLKFNLSNSFYYENSHLAMMMVGVIFTTLFILINKKINVFYYCLFFISVLITLINYSTTFAICYFICQTTLFLFFYKKATKTFWVISILFLLFNSAIFFGDKHCSKKVAQFDIMDVKNNKLSKRVNDEDVLKSRNFYDMNQYNEISKNLTTLIYERGFTVIIHTFSNRLLGWGNDGMDNATINYINRNEKICGKDIFPCARHINLKDGLSNLIKILTEFGIFSFILLYFFIKYLIKIKKLTPYNIFVITLFITMSIRGAGYFNGAFIFCVLEFFYLKEFKKNESTI